MSYARYTGRIVFGVLTVGAGLWATHQDLLPVPAYQFWLGLLCYLLAAQVVWVLVERLPSSRGVLTRQGLRHLAKDEAVSKPGVWLFDGGRVRLADILSGNIFTRDTHQGLLSAVLNREGRPRLHLLTGDPGTGRSVLLLHLGLELARQEQTVFAMRPTALTPDLTVVLDQARKGQVYLLIDDLDLQPQAEEWLYTLMGSPLPVVVLATTRQAVEPGADEDGLAALRPAGFLSQATIHKPRLMANDFGALARRLAAHGRKPVEGLAAEAAHDFLTALEQLQGLNAARPLWSLTGAADLPFKRQVILALLGAAELAVSEALWVSLLGDKVLSRWQRAGLLAVEEGLALPPHSLVCLEMLARLEQPATQIAEALDTLREACLAKEPRLVPRLLFALSRAPQVAPFVRDWLECRSPELQQSTAPTEWERLWQPVHEALGLPVTAGEIGDYPPRLSLQAQLAFERCDYQQALELSRRLSRTAVYQVQARFNVALALAHLGRLDETAAELADLDRGPQGTQYLRGYVSEKRGDFVKALDAFEASRKADELQLASTRRLAYCYVRSGAPRAAIPLYEAALAYNPLRSDLYGGLAVAHLHAGMGQRALAQSARAIQAGVDPLVARKAVARACAEVHAYDRAATELEACVSFDPTDLQAWRELGVACRWLGRFVREEDCLRRLQLADPDSPQLQHQLALCQRDQGRPEEAMQLLQVLLQAHAELPQSLLRPALLLAAELAATLDQADRQREYAARALTQGEDSGWASYHLAEGLAPAEAVGHYAAALTAFRAALEEGLPPRHAARLWLAVHRIAEKLHDEKLQQLAQRRARQEITVCATLGAEIESVYHRRAVPAAVSLEALPQPEGEPAKGLRVQARSEPLVVEAPILRTRFGTLPAVASE